MNAEIKELLKKTLQMTDEKELLKFFKSYATKNKELAEAVIEKFLPVENTMDYQKEVADCFAHKKKGKCRDYETNLDWPAIRKDIKLLLKQLNFILDQGDVETSINAAILLLKKLGENLEGIYYYGHNCGDNTAVIDAAITIVRDVMVNAKSISRERKLPLLDELTDISQMLYYRNYNTELDELVNDLRKMLLTPKELLKVLDSAISKCKYETEKVFYLEWKVNTLFDMGEDLKAEAIIDKNIDIERMAEMKIDRLIEQKNLTAALELCQKLIKGNNPTSWYLSMYNIACQAKNTDYCRRGALGAILSTNINTEGRFGFYQKYKDSFTKEEWEKQKKQVLKLLFKDNTDFYYRYVIEEKLYDDLFERLNKICNGDRIGSGYILNSLNRDLSTFVNHAKFLKEEQVNQIGIKYIGKVKYSSERMYSRNDYAEVAENLHLLSTISDKFNTQVTNLAKSIMAHNKNKPALKEEFKKYFEE